MRWRRPIFVAVFVLFSGATTMSSAQSAGPVFTSTGLECTVVGTAKPDRLTGTSGPDVICGLGGGDVLDGSGGDDLIDGGRGRDRLIGGVGDDNLLGGQGADEFLGGEGADTVSYADHAEGVVANLDGVSNDGAQRERDRIAGDVENLTGGSGSDRLTGDARDNRVIGGPGDDQLDTGAVALATQRLATSLDVSVSSTGDSVFGGPGADTCTYDSGLTYPGCDLLATPFGTLTTPTETTLSIDAALDVSDVRLLEGVLKTWDGTAVSGVGIVALVYTEDIWPIGADATLNQAITDGAGRFAMAVPVGAQIHIQLGNINGYGGRGPDMPSVWGVDAWIPTASDLTGLELKLPRAHRIDVQISNVSGPMSSAYVSSAGCGGGDAPSFFGSGYDFGTTPDIGGAELWPGGPPYEYMQSVGPRIAVSPSVTVTDLRTVTDAGGSAQVWAFPRSGGSSFVACNALTSPVRAWSVWPATWDSVTGIPTEPSRSIVLDDSYATFSGRLLDSSGHALPGIRLRSYVGWNQLVVSAVTTDGSGAFTLPVPVGPSMRIHVGNWGSGNFSPDQAGSRTAEQPSAWSFDFMKTFDGNLSTDVIMPTAEHVVLHVADTGGNPIQGAQAFGTVEAGPPLGTLPKCGEERAIAFNSGIRSSALWLGGPAIEQSYQVLSPFVAGGDSRLISDSNGLLHVWAFGGGAPLTVCFRSPAGFLVAARITVDAGTDANPQVVLDLSGAPISGRLRSAEGVAVAGVAVSFYRQGESVVSSSTVSLADGSFSLPVPQGDGRLVIGNLYGLGARTSEQPTTWGLEAGMSIDGPRSLGDVVLPPTSPIVVRIVDTFGAAIPGAWLDSGQCWDWLKTASWSVGPLWSGGPAFTLRQALGRGLLDAAYRPGDPSLVAGPDGRMTAWAFDGSLPVSACYQEVGERGVSSLVDLLFGVDATRELQLTL